MLAMDQRTKYTLQYMMDFFDHYWRDEWRDWKDKYDNGSREPVLRRLKVPRRRYLPRRADRAPEGPRLRVQQDRKSWLGPQNTKKCRDFVQRISRGEFGVVNFTQPLGLELRKILGRGGEGFACLFRLSHKDGSERDIVVKAALRNTAMALEMGNMKVGHRH